MPPENTKYFKQHIVDMFYTELDMYTVKYNNVLLLGDSNARTALLDDLVGQNGNLFDFIHTDSTEIFETDAFSEIQNSNNFTINRRSKDKTVNCMCRALIDHCKSNDLIILNGRSFNDAPEGKFTCQESSVVDYILSSSKLILKVSHFEVEDFSPLLSDKHCIVTSTINLNRITVSEDPTKESLRIKRWRDEFAQTFITNINIEYVDNISNNMPDVGSVDKCSLNILSDDIGAIIK